jgi:hypothetical protein
MANGVKSNEEEGEALERGRLGIMLANSFGAGGARVISRWWSEA